MKNRKSLEIAVSIEQAPESKGLVFVMHGLGGFKEQPHVRAMGDTFKENGYSVTYFDNTNSIGESGGKYEDATMGQYYNDLEDVVEWAKNQDWFQAPFFLAGHSLGAYNALQYAEDYPEVVKGVFAFAPVVSGDLSIKAHELNFTEELKSWKETGWTKRISNSKPGMELHLPWSHMEERLNHDLLPKVSNLTMPVLIVVGEKDDNCPPNFTKILFDKIPGRKEMYVVDGAPHTFREDRPLAELKERLTSWLNKI